MLLGLFRQHKVQGDQSMWTDTMTNKACLCVPSMKYAIAIAASAAAAIASVAAAALAVAAADALTTV